MRFSHHSAVQAKGFHLREWGDGMEILATSIKGMKVVIVATSIVGVKEKMEL